MHIQIDINTEIEINGLEDLPKLNLLMERSNTWNLSKNHI